MMMKTNRFALLATVAAFANAGWKLDADGKIEMKDGNPVWVDANGGEAVLNGETIARLNSEARTLRQQKEQAEEKVRSFEGLDPVKARGAIDKLKDIDTSKLIDAGKLEEVKRQISGEYEAKLTEANKARETVQQRYDSERVNNLFASSDFIRDRVAVPRDMFEATFRNNFKIEDDKITAYGRDGNRLMSKKNIGDYADAHEAIQLLVDTHPHKDTILRADAGSGSGSGGNGGNRGGGRTMKRSEFDKLDPVAQSQAAQAMGKGDITIVD
jgi:hypothetical protein